PAGRPTARSVAARRARRFGELTRERAKDTLDQNVLPENVADDETQGSRVDLRVLRDRNTGVVVFRRKREPPRSGVREALLGRLHDELGGRVRDGRFDSHTRTQDLDRRGDTVLI